jgi:hypothetical protein
MTTHDYDFYWANLQFDEERYIYLGDTWDQLYDSERCGKVCDAVLRGDGSGRVLRGRNRNQAVRFPSGDIEIVPGARLRLKDKYESGPN